MPEVFEESSWCLLSVSDQDVRFFVVGLDSGIGFPLQTFDLNPSDFDDARFSYDGVDTIVYWGRGKAKVASLSLADGEVTNIGPIPYIDAVVFTEDEVVLATPGQFRVYEDIDALAANEPTRALPGSWNDFNLDYNEGLFYTSWFADGRLTVLNAEGMEIDRVPLRDFNDFIDGIVATGEFFHILDSRNGSLLRFNNQGVRETVLAFGMSLVGRVSGLYCTESSLADG
ncbi:MAG: hypothetical protein AAGA48_39125 [Myxococcota bacterium]